MNFFNFLLLDRLFGSSCRRPLLIKPKGARMKSDFGIVVGHQFLLPNSFTIVGTNSGSMMNAYRNSPMMIAVAICSKDKTPDGSIAAKAPPKIMAAEIITVYIFFIACRNHGGIR